MPTNVITTRIGKMRMYKINLINHHNPEQSALHIIDGDWFCFDLKKNVRITLPSSQVCKTDKDHANKGSLLAIFNKVLEINNKGLETFSIEVTIW